MPAVSVTVPPSITGPEQQLEVSCEAATVGEALRAVAARAPRYAQRLFFRDRLLVSVLVNGVVVPPAGALDTTLTEGDRVEVMAPVAGG